MSSSLGGDLWRPATVEEYHAFYREIESYKGSNYARWLEYMRAYGEQDLFFLARFILSTRNPTWLVRGKQALDHDFPLWFARKIERDEAEADTIHLISREHLKSTFSTFAKTIQINLRTPNRSVLICSDTLNLSISFMSQIASEYRENELLPEIWPDRCWEDPKNQSPYWKTGESKPGLLLRRTSNQKEVSVTPMGLDTAIQTGPHYDVIRYDDIVTRRNTRSPQLMQKTWDNLKASYSLGKDGGYSTYVGTTYHPLDAYAKLQEREDIDAIRVPCYVDMPGGQRKPVYYSSDYLEKKRRECGEEEFAIQWLLDPSFGQIETFDETWFREYDPYKEVPVH